MTTSDRDRSLTSHPDLIEVERHFWSNVNKVIFVVGAGASRPAGFPLWHEMLQSLKDYGDRTARLQSKNVHRVEECIAAGNYLEAGEILRTDMGSRVDTHLHELFSRDVGGNIGLYEYLIQLPCAGYITTNYDNLIETAYARYVGSSLVPVLPGDRSALGSLVNRTRPFLLKIHGDVVRREFVLAESDYARLENNPTLERCLYSLAYNYKLVFIGYGFSDRDIALPLRLLSTDYGSGATRHVALLPEPVSPAMRRVLEDEASVNICGYARNSDHEQVIDILRTWVRNLEAANLEQLRPSDEPRVIAKTFGGDPEPLVPKVATVIARARTWLLELDSRWGPTPQAAPRAATVAEALIALHSAERALGFPFDPQPAIGTLLDFQDDEGSFVSHSLGAANVQTHALALFALSLQSTDDQSILDAIHRGTRWLQDHTSQGGLGWARFGGPQNSINLVSSIWAFGALTSLNSLDHEHWRRFRALLLDAPTFDFVLGGEEDRVVVHAWILWLLSVFWDQGHFESQDEKLVKTCAERLLNADKQWLSEVENYHFDPSPEEGLGGKIVSWIHPTAPAVVLGTSPWVRRKPTLWEPLGAAVSTLLKRASEGLDGHFRSTHELERAAPFVFHTTYSMWALADFVARATGRWGLGYT